MKTSAHIRLAFCISCANISDFERDGFTLQNPVFQAFVAEAQNSKQVIGCALYFKTYSVITGRTIHLEDFYVTPEFREKGYGKRLFNAVAKVCHLTNTKYNLEILFTFFSILLCVLQMVKEQNFSAFTLQCLDWNVNALKFYEARGGINLTKLDDELSLRFLRDRIKYLSSNV